MANLVTSANPAQRQTLSAGVIQNLGLKPDGTFDPATFLQNYGKTTQNARDMLFGPAQGGIQGDLNNLATVQGTMAGSAANKNFSNTAPVLATINALGSLFTGLATGSAKAGLASLAPLAGSEGAGRVMSSRPFVQWLTGTYGVNPAAANAWTNHLARLGTVAVADPGLRDFVTQLRGALPEQISQPGSQPAQ